MSVTVPFASFHIHALALSRADFSTAGIPHTLSLPVATEGLCLVL